MEQVTTSFERLRATLDRGGPQLADRHGGLVIRNGLPAIDVFARKGDRARYVPGAGDERRGHEHDTGNERFQEHGFSTVPKILSRLNLSDVWRYSPEDTNVQSRTKTTIRGGYS